MEGVYPGGEAEQSEVTMQRQNLNVGEAEERRGGNSSLFGRQLRSEKGMVLLMVIVLSAVSLLIMTTLIYMITMGTQVSGLQKRYKTALEAGIGGSDIFIQLIALRAETGGTNAFTANLNAFSLNPSLTTPGACSGLVSAATYSGLAAKLLTPRTTWTNCNSSITIDPAISTSYDMKIDLGTTEKYSVYAKIVSTTDGNTGGDDNLANKGVVSGASSGSVEVMARPYLYAIELVSESNTRKDERAKLSVMYQY